MEKRVRMVKNMSFSLISGRGGSEVDICMAG